MTLMLEAYYSGVDAEGVEREVEVDLSDFPGDTNGLAEYLAEMFPGGYDFHGYSPDFGPAIDANLSVGQMLDLVSASTEIDSEREWELFVSYYLEMGDASVSDFEEAYQGIFENMSDFAEDLLTSIYNIDDGILPYVDFERAGEDLSGDYITISHGSQIAVFRSF